MNRIVEKFAQLKNAGKKGFIVYIGAGDPNLDATRELALAAVKIHLKTFKISGHNPEGNYWWARDAEGLRKCWISNAE